VRTLFIIGSYHETRILTKLAARMAALNHKVMFLFIKEGCLYLKDEKFVDSIDFAEGRNALKGCVEENLVNSIKGVDVIDYDGWVRLLEACENVVSWT